MVIYCVGLLDYQTNLINNSGCNLLDTSNRKAEAHLKKLHWARV